LPPQLQTIHSAAEHSRTDSQLRPPQPSERARIEAESLVLHRDSAVLVINKPSGLATQGGSGITEHVDGLLDLLKFERKQRPRLVHRLDRDTSGVLVVARTAPAAAALSESLRHRDASKIYWALTRGVPHPLRGTIRSALAKEAIGREEKMAMVEQDAEGARSAVTEYAVVEAAGSEFAWVAVKPVTGRMHQIRVHLASLGTPIVGDFKYGGTEARGQGEIENRLHLHARSIDSAHPDGGRVRVTAPLSAHMRDTWTLLGFDPNAQTPFEENRKRR
jgi:23S rRNA pseudouridine955/2504/2580 synthase